MVQRKVTIVQQSSAERQEYIDELGEDPGVLFNYFTRYEDEAFVDHVEKYLPKRNIRSAIRIGKDFHDCGIGFESKEAAEDAANRNTASLLEFLEKAGHPWTE